MAHKNNFIFKKYPEGNVTQWFGENPELYGKAVCQNGVCMTGGHNGIDIVSPHGTPLYIFEAGKVVDVNDNPAGYGKHIRVLTKTGREWTYGHLSKIAVELGQEVKENDYFGDMGNTGFVISGATPYWKHNPYAGTHLHVTVRNIKRTKRGWSYATGERVEVLDYNNGTLGAVNPLPILEDLGVVKQRGLTAEQQIQIQESIVTIATQVVDILKWFISNKK